jgi:hypothetical protein
MARSDNAPLRFIPRPGVPRPKSMLMAIQRSRHSAGQGSRGRLMGCDFARNVGRPPHPTLWRRVALNPRSGALIARSSGRGR